MRYFGCLMDGRILRDTQEDLARHLGHRLIEATPTWWGRLMLWLGR